ncbi:MAG TPA: Rieske 2Fe-2S domain-containing protein [Gammaproteobacteria bacterium]|nr:Rieske 2Fe-2S domain-containing protein [Gammaproteobacteria bacterium]
MKVCQTDDIIDNSARGFSVNTPGGMLDIFVVRKGNRFYGYRNSCPHTGINLEWQADDFLDTGASFIQCSNHGARFRISDGFCIYGPCNGRYLAAVSLSVDNGVISLLAE